MDGDEEWHVVAVVIVGWIFWRGMDCNNEQRKRSKQIKHYSNNQSTSN